MNIKLLFLAYFLVHMVYQSPALAQLYNGSSKIVGSVEQLVQSLEPGDVLVLGEFHDNIAHHQNHEAILNELHAQGRSFDVGMEFFYDWRKQNFVDQYLRDEINEATFLQSMQWGGDSFSLYRNKVLWPLEVGGWTWAINAPKELTRYVSHNGLSSLPSELQALMPPHFELGNSKYFDRFKTAVGGDHVPPEKLANYFAAQSIWDETMAWKSLEKLGSSNAEIFVIIVGDFHASFGGGLPDRLIQRGAQRVVTLSQVDVNGMNQEEKNQLLQPHPEWGQRADWIWLTDHQLTEQ